MSQAIENINEFYKQKHTDFVHKTIALHSSWCSHKRLF